MATLYATATHRGIAFTWTGLDLTGLTGSNLSIVFVRNSDGERIVGAGAFSNPVVTTNADGSKSSATTYTPALSDVAMANVGEWRCQMKANFGGSNIELSTLGVVEIVAPL